MYLSVQHYICVCLHVTNLITAFVQLLARCHLSKLSMSINVERYIMCTVIVSAIVKTFKIMNYELNND